MPAVTSNKQSLRLLKLRQKLLDEVELVDEDYGDAMTELEEAANAVWRAITHLEAPEEA